MAKRAKKVKLKSTARRRKKAPAGFFKELSMKLGTTAFILLVGAGVGATGIIYSATTRSPVGKTSDKQEIAGKQQQVTNDQLLKKMDEGFGKMIDAIVASKAEPKSGQPAAKDKELFTIDLDKISKAVKDAVKEVRIKTAPPSDRAPEAQDTQPNGKPQALTRNGNGVPQPGTEDYAKVAAQAYQSLGPTPTGGQVKNFQITENVSDFKCPNGAQAKQVAKVDGNGYIFTRWACPKAGR